jgi:hypothetical protein
MGRIVKKLLKKLLGTNSKNKTLLVRAIKQEEAARERRKSEDMNGALLAETLLMRGWAVLEVIKFIARNSEMLYVEEIVKATAVRLGIKTYQVSTTDNIISDLRALSNLGGDSYYDKLKELHGSVQDLINRVIDDDQHDTIDGVIARHSKRTT